MPSENLEASRALIAYVPALHAGYVTLFTKYADCHVFVLGKTFIDAYPRLNRDIRALAPEEAVRVIDALGIVASVKVLEIEGATSELASFGELVVPEDDVTEAFVEEYAQGRAVHRESIFLRWDISSATKELPVIADQTVSTEELDIHFMSEANRESAKSADWWRQIGGVLVKDGATLYSGHTRYFPSDQALNIFGTPRSSVDFGERPDLYISMHAEADLIGQAAGAGVSVKGSSVYVSTFPCINCAFLLARAGVAKVFYTEGYSKLDSAGVLRGAGIEIIQVPPR